MWCLSSEATDAKEMASNINSDCPGAQAIQTQGSEYLNHGRGNWPTTFKISVQLSEYSLSFYNFGGWNASILVITVL